MIPFGLYAATGKYVDIFEVARGKDCGCICPSCCTPLIARHGEVNEWHFAHASRDVYEHTKKECEFSFFVSVRLMARQMVESSITMCLPEYVDEVSACTNDYKEISVPFNVASEQEAILTEVSVEENYENIPVDIIGKIEKHDFIIYFTHPNRDVPIELTNPKNIKCGMIEISLDQTYQLFGNSTKLAGNSYKEILLSFLRGDLPSKKWIFHPRYKMNRERAEKDLSEKIELENSRISKKYHDINRINENAVDQSCHTEDFHIISQEHAHHQDQERKPAIYKCALCSIHWEGIKPMNTCPECKQHLFSKFIKYIE